jgi:hypothetical protein
VVRPSCGGRLFSVCVGFSGREKGDVWFCLRSCLEVKEREARRCHTSMLCVEQDLPQSSQEENMLRVDAQAHTQGESLPCLWL